MEASYDPMLITVFFFLFFFTYYYSILIYSPPPDVYNASVHAVGHASEFSVFTRVLHLDHSQVCGGDKNLSAAESVDLGLNAECTHSHCT